MKKERKKGEQKLALSFFFLLEKKWRLLGEVSQTSGLRLGLPPKNSRVNVVSRGLRYNFTVRRS